MTRTERLLAILQMLREARLPVTAARIGERFGISERTAYRDVATLTHQGAMIVGEAGVGFVLRDDYFIPPLSFDADEAAALLLGLRFVLRRGDAALGAAAASARAKLAAVLPDRFSRGRGDGGDLVVAPMSRERKETLAIVRAASVAWKRLRISYTADGNNTSERVVWPLVIGWFDGFEMIGAWCETRQAFRHFRIDRIAHAQMMEDGPPRARSALLAEYREFEPGIEF